MELEAPRGAGEFLFGGEEGAYRRVRADVGALVALDAVLLDPFRDVDGDASLLEACGGEGEDAVGGEGGDREVVSLLAQDGEYHLAHVIGHMLREAEVQPVLIVGVAPGLRVIDLHQALHREVDGAQVHLDHLVTLAAVLLADRVLEELHGPLEGEHPGELEEGGLHDHVDAAAEPGGGGDADGVHVVKADLLAGYVAPHAGWEMPLHILHRVPGGVQQKGPTLLDPLQKVVDLHVGRFLAGDEVGRVDEVGGLDRAFAEAQVGDGDPPRLLGVVGEVGLHVEVGVVADDLDRGLVGPDGAVRTHSPEAALDGSLRRGGKGSLHREGSVAHIVGDPHGEVALARGAVHVVEDALHVHRPELLGAQTVAPGVEFRNRAAALHEGGADVLVERLAQRPRLLRAVEHRDLARRRRNHREERPSVEGAVQPHLDEPHLLAGAV